MLTEEEKKMIVEVISQLQFKVGDSAIAKKFENNQRNNRLNNPYTMAKAISAP